MDNIDFSVGGQVSKCMCLLCVCVIATSYVQRQAESKSACMHACTRCVCNAHEDAYTFVVIRSV